MSSRDTIDGQPAFEVLMLPSTNDRIDVTVPACRDRPLPDHRLAMGRHPNDVQCAECGRRWFVREITP